MLWSRALTRDLLHNIISDLIKKKKGIWLQNDSFWLQLSTFLMVYFLNSLLQTDKPQEQVARVIKSCNGTELILAHFKESPWRRLTFPFKTSSGDLWVSCEFSGLGFSEASSSKMSLPHFILHFVHFVSFLSLAVFSIWSLSLPLSLSFTSWSYQHLGSGTTERQSSTWREQTHNSTAVSNTHACTDTHTCL